MNITIAQRLQPFSHEPGTICLIPGTAWQVQAFPMRFVVTSPTGASQVFSPSLSGPVHDFTLLQDLERGYIAIFGTWQEGFFYWRIEAKENALWLTLQRTPEAGCLIGERRLQRKDALRIASIDEMAPNLSQERLSFGCHKKQEWEGIRRRMDMSEILPFWFRMGQVIPSIKGSDEVLFSIPEDKEDMPKALHRLFQGHFRSMLVPSVIDDLHQGLDDVLVRNKNSSPLLFLQEGAKIIRSLFFREEKERFALLPALASPWHCGRFTGLRTSSGDVFDLEWSKKQIRRVVVHPGVSREIRLIFPTAIKSFRMRTDLQSKGNRRSTQESLFVEAGIPLYLDRFEK